MRMSTLRQHWRQSVLGYLFWQPATSLESRVKLSATTEMVRCLLFPNWQPPVYIAGRGRHSVQHCLQHHPTRDRLGTRIGWRQPKQREGAQLKGNAKVRKGKCKAKRKGKGKGGMAKLLGKEGRQRDQQQRVGGAWGKAAMRRRMRNGLASFVVSPLPTQDQKKPGSSVCHANNGPMRSAPLGSCSLCA